MRWRKVVEGMLSLIFLLSIATLAYSSNVKNIRVGKYRCWVIDSADEGKSVISVQGGYYYHAFQDYMYYRRGWALGSRDWIDENGDQHDIKVVVDGTEVADELNTQIPVPDNDGNYIYRYRRYQPPYVSVDGFRTSYPWPLDETDIVDPSKIPGTADEMVESWVNTSMGVTIHQRVLAWSQNQHDDYVIYIWTFKNTGNIDADPEIELPDQTLHDLYFLRTIRSNKHHNSPRGTNWHSAYGEHMSDSMRISYFYSSKAPAATYDSFGNIENQSIGFLVNPEYVGEVTLHIDTSPSDHTDDPSQPQMTDTGNSEDQAFKNASSMLNEAQILHVYDVMQTGFVGYYPQWEYMDDPDIYPNTHHAVHLDEIGFKYPDEPWGRGHANSFTASGPFNLARGDSITMMWASVVGSISPEKGWEVGRAWASGNATPPPGNTWNGGNPDDNLPPPFKMYPDYYEGSENNWAKDCWVATGKDSIFQNAWAAQWNVQHGFNVPIPPPAPSVQVTSLPDKINIQWDGTEQGTEDVADFTGYRVYRSIGSPYYSEEQNVVVGNWERIFECGEGTANPEIVHSYDDAGAERGKGYYYYVTAFDDGSDNGPDVYNPQGGKSLESGRFLTMTTRPASLTRNPGVSLDDIRVVPNPYNIGATALNFPGEPNKLLFTELPPLCTIRIFTQAGDLIKTIEHTDRSGDETWGELNEEFQATQEGQIVVSGIYIANITTPEGQSKNVKFVIVR